MKGRQEERQKLMMMETGGAERGLIMREMKRGGWRC